MRKAKDTKNLLRPLEGALSHIDLPTAQMRDPLSQRKARLALANGLLGSVLVESDINDNSQFRVIKRGEDIAKRFGLNNKNPRISDAIGCWSRLAPQATGRSPP